MHKEHGELVTWKADRYFGFIRPSGYAGSDRDCFVYGGDLPEDIEPMPGVQLRFVRGADARGRIRAEQVERA